jgi:hypothetical protein
MRPEQFAEIDHNLRHQLEFFRHQSEMLDSGFKHHRQSQLKGQRGLQAYPADSGLKTIGVKSIDPIAFG